MFLFQTSNEILLPYIIYKFCTVINIRFDPFILTANYYLEKMLYPGKHSN